MCSPVLRDPLFHCIYLTCLNIRVLLADLLQRCEIWVRLRASNRLHRSRALTALRLTKVVDQGRCDGDALGQEILSERPDAMESYIGTLVDEKFERGRPEEFFVGRDSCAWRVRDPASERKER